MIPNPMVNFFTFQTLDPSLALLTSPLTPLLHLDLASISLMTEESTSIYWPLMTTVSTLQLLT